MWLDFLVIWLWICFVAYGIYKLGMKLADVLFL